VVKKGLKQVRCGKCGVALTCSGYCITTGFCKHDGELLAYLKCEEFFDQLSNYQVSRMTLLNGVSWLV
jgi:hypothetical protein